MYEQGHNFLTVFGSMQKFKRYKNSCQKCLLHNSNSKQMKNIINSSCYWKITHNRSISIRFRANRGNGPGACF